MTSFPFSLLAKALGVIVLLAVFVLGYMFGLHTSATSPETSQDILVKLSYSGGWLSNEDDATSWKAIYTDGRVSKATRGGDISELASITPSQVAALRELINAPDFIEAGFPKKERKFCASAVDGIDMEIALTRDDGTIVSYSNCEYDLYDDAFHVLTLMDFLTHQATN